MDSGQEQIAAALWKAADAGRRGPKPRLSVEQIVAAAIDIADAEGLAASSMQRIGERLNVTKMALYRHIGSRSALLALMLDAAMGPPPTIDDSVTKWQAALAMWAHAAYNVCAEHPWLMQIAVGPRVFGPNELGWTEQGLTILADTRLSPAERLDALALISGHVRSLAQQGFGHDGRRVSDTESGIRRAMASVFAAHGARYPAVAEALGSSTPEHAADNALDFGLDRILDGIEAHHNSVE